MTHAECHVTSRDRFYQHYSTEWFIEQVPSGHNLELTASHQCVVNATNVRSLGGSATY